eukprot:CAMPEP_0177664204 /NCGR_PEP_ID=MMETSP0447-20121125/20358_1 /TAXON_ID=0 /ORGANISM="Stygamoeba regulata, Strain BSH-02190019" /LENGTH=179 /DNA_ID=CAMNT_0019170139 /DNA_START=11 /DNA_END=550 /DNA_ORIENTATION=+
MTQHTFPALLFVLVCLGGAALAHSTIYPDVDPLTCKDSPPFRSFHIHCLFWHADKESTAGALKLRDDFIKEFNLANVTLCKDLFHEDRLCMFEIENYPVGPFVTGQWSAFLLPEHYARATQWIMQHRGIYDILIHPNTGCGVEDHTQWNVWGGNPWEINTRAFSQHTPFPPAPLASLSE